MFELMFCSLLTIFPDYLYRRYAQGKRIGREITLFSVWYELRWGITLCLLLTLGLVTTIFYFHPATTSVTSFFRTVTILPESGGRVNEIYVTLGETVTAGQPLFSLDDSEQQAALETARRRIAEVDASVRLANTELVAADGRIQEAQSAYAQARDELATRTELQRRSPGTVAPREIEKLQNVVDQRQGSVNTAEASKESVIVQIETVLPAQKASAEAALQQAQVDLDKTVIRAGVDGTVEQFLLRKGDFVNPLMRPAGILVPTKAGRVAIQAGFNQIEAQVMKPGMLAEITCISKPFTVIPMVVTQVQDFIAAGQVRATDQLLDPQSVTAPGTLLVYLEPLYAGGTDDITPGSSCIANAYTSNQDRLADENLGSVQRIALHAVDTVGLVHALLLRIQALLMPFQILVLGGH
jgi:multidrug resistance efflux pump